MRNTIVLQDLIWNFPSQLTPELSLRDDSLIVDVCANTDKEEVFVLTKDGVLLVYNISDEPHISHEPWQLISTASDDSKWFSVQVINEVQSVVCISRSGSICSIQSDRSTDEWNVLPEHEGCVDDGIGDASWSPDQTCLALVTNNDSLLLMTNTVDVINEVPIETRSPNSPCVLTWRGDGMQFSLFSTDASDGIARVRIYDRDLNLLSTGKTVAEGSGAIVKNLLPAMAYAPNGSLIAVPQMRTPKKQQVVFFERSGLRHGEFDVQSPVPGVDGSAFRVTKLCYNIETTLLAACLQSTENPNSDQFVQVYYRNNAHWYLKQQWSGKGLYCHGFDAELSDRLFMSMKLPASQGDSMSGLCLRVIDLVWDTVVSNSADCTVAVADGKEVLLTPLGKALVPPPMSMHQLLLPSPSRHLSFWNTLRSSSFPWGMCVLCDGDVIRLWSGSVEDKRHVKPSCCEDISLSDVAQKCGIDSSVYCFRSVQAVECTSYSSSSTECHGNLVIVCIAGRIANAENPLATGDDVLVLHKVESTWRMDTYPIQASGRVLRLISWADDVDCIGIGLSTGSGVVSSFDVVKMSFHSDGGVEFSTEFTFAENCGRKLSVVGFDTCDATHKVDGEGSPTSCDRKYVCVGLTSAPHTSRFYCCDNLLSASHVSSFAVNPALGVLMFVTATSKPLLHFISLNSLHGMVHDIESNLLAGEAGAQPSYTFSAPRPVERGCRIVGSPNGSSQVVLQMPRGNLEGCDPRPLVLIRSRLLLDANKYLECLMLLRKQRVDLNLLVDHSPSRFIAHVPQFVIEAVGKSSDLLPLLVSGLENGNVCATKYPLPEMYLTKVAPMSTIAHSATSLGDALPTAHATDVSVDASSMVQFNWDEKVNTVCAHIRSALYDMHAKDSVVQKSQTNVDTTHILLPLLCCYAKQKPPLLAHGLYVIKRYALSLPITPRSEPSTTTASQHSMATALSTARAQKCLKYIAFLCDYKELFDAALGECDFDMARAVAKQDSQMDPKVYLPLLQKLQTFKPSDETTDNSHRIVAIDTFDTALETSPLRSVAQYCWMRFTVYSHLKRYDQGLLWALQCLDVLAHRLVTPAEDNGDCVDTNALVQDILSTVSTQSLHSMCFPILRRLRQKVATAITESAAAVPRSGGLQLRPRKKAASSNHPAIVLVSSLLSKVYHSYGESCGSKGEYSEAVSAYLSSSERDSPRAAVQCAIQSGDWSLALGIGGKYFDPEAAELQEEDENPFFQTQTVSSLDPKTIAQQLIDDYRSTLEQGFGGEDPESEHVTAFQHGSNSNDVSNSTSGDASSATVTTHDRAMEACNLCLDYFDDVEGAVGILLLSKRWLQAAQLASRKRRLDLLREEVGGVAKTEAKTMIRLLKVRQEKHLELVEKLSALWVDAPGRLTSVSGVDASLLAAIQGAMHEEAEDSRSDFGGGASVYSDISLASNMSESSTASSTLSMLSNISLSSSNVDGSRRDDSKSFAIEGLDHNLLSRGKTDKTEFSQYEHPKLRKRRQKRHLKHEGGGRDVFGLKQESAMSKKLYALGDVSSVARAVSEVCETLLLVGSYENQILACQLQLAMDQYIDGISASVAPQAPLYPIEWLQKRNMEDVRWFQSSPENNNPNNINAKKVWWRMAVQGIALWKGVRKVSLIAEVDTI